jgi:hypothetical protein
MPSLRDDILRKRRTGAFTIDQLERYLNTKKLVAGRGALTYPQEVESVVRELLDAGELLVNAKSFFTPQTRREVKPRKPRLAEAQKRTKDLF